MAVAGARTFPAVPVLDLEGRPVALEALWRGHGALLVVGHSDCETTRLALRHADRLHRRRRSPRVVAAVLQDEPEAARGLVEELGLELPVLLDRDPYALAAELGLTTVPALFQLDGSGALEERTEAFRRSDFEGFARALQVAEPFFGADEAAPALRPG